MRVLLILVMSLLITVDAWAVPFWLFTGGSNGTTNKSSIGIEVGGTQVIKDKWPLSAELSMNFEFNDIPSDTFFNSNTSNEPYTTRKGKYGPEIGYLFKSGVNLDEWVQNLTLQLGAGYSLQSTVTIATGSNTGKHWQVGHRETDVNPVGYAGILYRVQNICLSLGYNNRRGVVGGIGSVW